MLIQSVVKGAFCALAVCLVGCATIVGNPTQTIPIASTPSGAKVSIVDETGQEVFAGATPTTVTLQKSDGSYWGKKNFKVTISKDGFKPQVISVTASANGWYLAGNILLGGLIGWFIVDPLNGDMYTLSPKNISGSLDGGAVSNKSDDGKSIKIVLVQDVPLDMRHAMVKLN